MTDFGKSQKIVIVEDNVALNDIYKTRLEMLGYTVFSAYDGVQALTVIEHELPDLVLLDLMVPKKAGDQILEEMRQSGWGKDIKVVIISNLNEADAPKGLRNLGIEAYAVKANLSNDQLDQLVDAVLKPASQAEDVLLTGANHELQDTQPHNPESIPAADPMSGMSAPAPQPAMSTPQAPEATQAPTAPEAIDTLPPEAPVAGMQPDPNTAIAAVWPEDTPETEAAQEGSGSEGAAPVTGTPADKAL